MLAKSLGILRSSESQQTSEVQLGSSCGVGQKAIHVPARRQELQLAMHAHMKRKDTFEGIQFYSDSVRVRKHSDDTLLYVEILIPHCILSKEIIWWIKY